MHKLTTLMPLLLVVAIMFTSCKDDEVTPEVENQFTFDGEEYDLSKAYGREYDNGPSTTTVGYSLVLVSDNGSNSVMLLINVEDGTIEGTYTPTTTTGEEVHTFTGARVEIGYDPVNDTPGTIYRNFNTPGGKVTITKSGSEYVMDFDITLDAGEKVKGYYKGGVIWQ